MNTDSGLLEECMHVGAFPISVQRADDIVESSTRYVEDLRKLDIREGLSFVIMLLILAISSWTFLGGKFTMSTSVALAVVVGGCTYLWWRGAKARSYLTCCLRQCIEMMQPVEPVAMATVDAIGEREPSVKTFLARVREERSHLFAGEYLTIMKMYGAAN